MHVSLVAPQSTQLCPPHCNCSHRVPSLRESHEKPAVQQPSLFYRRWTSARAFLSYCLFLFRLSIRRFLVHVVHLTSTRIRLRFPLGWNVSADIRNTYNTSRVESPYSVTYLSLPHWFIIYAYMKLYSNNTSRLPYNIRECLNRAFQ